jgi:hypothetical protein
MAKIVKLTPELLDRRLRAYEQQYAMSSSDFLDRYQADELGDSEPIMEWAYLGSVALRRGVLTRQAART